MHTLIQPQIEIDLTDEQLASVSGGFDGDDRRWGHSDFDGDDRPRDHSDFDGDDRPRDHSDFDGDDRPWYPYYNRY